MARKQTSLKIKSKREKERARKKKKKVSKKRLVVKTAKFNKTLKKARKLARKAIKTAIKGTELKRIPEKLYRKVDAALAKNADFQNAIQAAVVAGMNEVIGAAKNTKKAKKEVTEKKVKKDAVAETEPATTA